ncbi:uncharacterized protein BKA55DRAFT_687274 [Fusarium redolens]|uniref:Uncharacterized protein n=1 Tax=Fusarium redolens TaxID=48865 RepID=A0A9P9HJZ4_FUSRE|nr:uncharacterized protein BKA55DRAFT_687274 [Fusarium redolens]KAH7258985.1 hypothetical protein BKA55DRAFT_687274 [Fusarium redolens]
MASIEKNMANYTVEFLDKDQRLHIVLPPGNCFEEGTDSAWAAYQELEKAMEKTKLSTFFQEDSVMGLKNSAEIFKTIVECQEVERADKEAQEDRIKSLQRRKARYENSLGEIGESSRSSG